MYCKFVSIQNGAGGRGGKIMSLPTLPMSDSQCKKKNLS